MAPLDEIVGEQLSSVIFVMDYLQLTFDGPILTAVTPPEVREGGSILRWGQAGYRDALCARIAMRVVEATSSPEWITLSFDDGATLAISLRAEDLCGNSAESALFQGKSRQMVVWRPGE